MSVEEYLQQWVRNAVFVCFDDEVIDTINENDENLCALLIGKSLLSLSDNATLADVFAELSLLHTLREPVEDLATCLKLLLVFSVSEQCELRADFVQNIMSLDSDVQIALMQVIQDNMQRNGDVGGQRDGRESEEVAQEDVDMYDNEDEAVFTVDEPPIWKERSEDKSFDLVKSKETNGGVTHSVCMSCSEKEAHIKRLQQEIVTSLKTFNEESLKLKDELSVASNKVVDLELMVMDKDNIIFQKTQALHDLDKTLQKCEALLAKNAKLEEQVLVLQDEIDILKPQAAKVDAAEAQIEKFRSKLDELNDIKQQLKVESKNHNDTYDKLIAAEQEVESLRKTKAQLDEYRAQFAESNITIQELEVRLHDSEEQVKLLSAHNEQLRGNQSENRDINKILAEELKTTAEQLREKERVNGIGEGMSELNPVLMQEMNKIRAENKELRDQLDQSSLQSLEALRRDVADQKCMNTSLQKKWMDTKDLLAKAHNDIKDLTIRLIEQCDLCEKLRLQMSELSSMSHEDSRSLKIKYGAHIQYLKVHERDALFLNNMGRSAIAGWLQADLCETSDTLDRTTCELTEMTALQQETAKTLEETQEELEEAGRKRKSYEMECEEKISHLHIEYEDKLLQESNRSSSLMNELNAKHSQELAVEAARITALLTDLEEEKIKRRKVERLKLYHEQEAQRQKVMLQAQGASGGGIGVDTALSEMRSMQQELDEAHAEIAQWKAKVAQMSASADSSSSSDSAQQSSHPGGALRAPPARSLRSNRGISSSTGLNSDGSSLSGISTEGSHNALSVSSLLEQVELAQKKIDQLAREKREEVSKRLEEMKEKNELSQKLLLMEKDFSNLKAELRKITLEKERNERKLSKQIEVLSGGLSNKENITV